MPKTIRGTNQTAIDLDLSIGVSGDNVTAARHEANWQALINNDATLETRITSFRLTTGAGIDGANAGVGIGSITISIPTDGIVTSMVTDAAITLAKLAANSVNASKLIDNAVTTVKIEDAAITLAKIASAAVDSSKIADNAVITVKINDQAVTTVKLADGAVTSAKLANGSVDALKIDATNTPTAGQTLVVGSNNRFTFEDKPSVNARGTLIAVSNSINSGDIDGWSIQTGLPSGVTVDIGNTLIRNAVAIRFPKIKPSDRTIGLWAVLRDNTNTEIDEVFIPYGSTLAQGVPIGGTGVVPVSSSSSYQSSMLVSNIRGSGNQPYAYIVIAQKTYDYYKVAFGDTSIYSGVLDFTTTQGHTVALYFATN